MRRRLAVLAGIAALAMTLPALAESPDFTYLEVGLADIDPDMRVLDSGDGWFAAGSWGGRRHHVFAEYSESDFDIDFGVPDIVARSAQEGWVLGFGWHGLLGERADLLIEGGYVDIDARQTIVVQGLGPTVFSSSDDGFLLGAGLRAMVTPRVEIDAFVSHLEMDASSDERRVSAAAIGFFGRLGIGGSFSTSDRRDQINLFLRYRLGRS